MRRGAGIDLETFFQRERCTSAERRACLEYLAFLRFRRLLRQPEGLRFLFLVFAEDLLS
jgi:hypothetical protein